MKKIIYSLVTLFVVTLLFSSCKSHGTCPAYGKVQKTDTEKVAV